jgi:hypothetical protein
MELMKALDEMSLSAADWRETPVAVQKLVKVLWAENQELKKRQYSYIRWIFYICWCTSRI